MVVTRTPMRITLAGGGTDLLWYAKLRGGAWVSATIDKYVYVFISKFEEKSFLKVSDGETVTITDDYRRIPNSIIRECLDITGVKSGIEIATMSDVSGRSGLGGSGAFEVGLLHALHVYKKESISARQLAEEACEVEIERLGKPVGPQDQYITAYGGFNYFELDRKGKIKVSPLKLSKGTVSQLESNFIFFRTGMTHDTAKIHGEGKKSVDKKDKDFSRFIKMYDDIKELGKTAKDCLFNGKVDEYGATLHKHWLIKTRQLAATNLQINEWYKAGIRLGALGGKIMGAGGGGWFVFYVNNNKAFFCEEMKKLGLEEGIVHFEFEGSKVLMNLS